MSNKTFTLPDALYDYVLSVSLREEPLLQRVLELLRPGGLIAIDNTLWSGSVINPSCQDTDTRAIRAFNKALHTNARVHISLVPIADGLTLALKRSTVNA